MWILFKNDFYLIVLIFIILMSTMSVAIIQGVAFNQINMVYVIWWTVVNIILGIYRVCYILINYVSVVECV